MPSHSLALSVTGRISADRKLRLTYLTYLIYHFTTPTFSLLFNHVTASANLHRHVLCQEISDWRLGEGSICYICRAIIDSPVFEKCFNCKCTVCTSPSCDYDWLYLKKGKIVTRWSHRYNPEEFRDQSEKFYYGEGKEINLDFRSIRKCISNMQWRNGFLKGSVKKKNQNIFYF